LSGILTQCYFCELRGMFQADFNLKLFDPVATLSGAELGAQKDNRREQARLLKNSRFQKSAEFWG
jgi:hypothetical protein